MGGAKPKEMEYWITGGGGGGLWNDYCEMLEIATTAGTMVLL